MLAFFLDHWWQFNYAPVGEPWYHGATWSNVFVLLPLAVLGAIGFVYHLAVTKRLHAKIDELAARHDEHAAHMKVIFDLLDPETDGGLGDVHDLLDPDTPSGIGVLRERLDELVGRG